MAFIHLNSSILALIASTMGVLPCVLGQFKEFWADWDKSLCVTSTCFGAPPCADRNKQEWEPSYGSLQECCDHALFWKRDECLLIGSAPPPLTPNPNLRPNLFSSPTPPSPAPRPNLFSSPSRPSSTHIKPGCSAHQYVLQPLADTYVNRKRQNKEYNNRDVLKVDGNKVSLLKFRLPVKGKKIKSASLSLFSIQDAEYGGEIVHLSTTMAADFAKEDDWNADTMTWSHYKSIASDIKDSCVLGELKRVKAEQWYDVDVTNAVKAAERSGDYITFVIRSDRGCEAGYSSNEDNDFAPTLTITRR